MCVGEFRFPRFTRNDTGWALYGVAPSPQPLWIADQVRNDGRSFPAVPRPVDSRLRGNDGVGGVVAVCVSSGF